MINAVINQVAAWLDDPTSGVNAVSAGIPLDVGETLPPVVRVVAETQEGWAARARLTKDQVEAGPLLLVRMHAEAPFLVAPAPFTLDPQSDAEHTGHVPVAILYAAKGSATETEVGVARQILRTALRVVAVAFDAVPEVTRAQVAIARPNKPGLYLPLLDAGDGDVLLLGVVLEFPTHDPWALGA